MAKGFAPAPESPQRQAQPIERKLAVDAEQVQQVVITFRPWQTHGNGKDCSCFLEHCGHRHLGSGGATGWEDIELYGESHQEWLGNF